MDRCPLCRATLGGADICRRCRADLTAVKALARNSQALATASAHLLAEGDIAAAHGLARRAAILHATPQHKVLAVFLHHLQLDLDDEATHAESA